MTLRARIYGTKAPDIIILANEDHIKAQWEQLKYFDNMWVINGNPLNCEDLKSAGVKCAYHALIIGRIESNDESETIFIYRAIKNLN